VYFIKGLTGKKPVFIVDAGLMNQSKRVNGVVSLTVTVFLLSGKKQMSHSFMDSETCQTVVNFLLKE
jgi:hypothetical protein